MRFDGEGAKLVGHLGIFGGGHGLDEAQLFLRRALQRRGVVMGGYLRAVQVRLLVMTMLATGASRESIAAEVRRRGGYR